MPFGPALPKGGRTPSTKTTSRSERDMGPPRGERVTARGGDPSKLPGGNGCTKRASSTRVRTHPYPRAPHTGGGGHGRLAVDGAAAGALGSGGAAAAGPPPGAERGAVGGGRALRRGRAARGAP